MLAYTIQYDRGDESDLVHSSYIEAENVKHAIEEFETIFKGYRILSIELIPKNLIKPEAWEKLYEYQQRARNRVIACLD